MTKLIPSPRLALVRLACVCGGTKHYYGSRRFRKAVAEVFSEDHAKCKKADGK